MTARPDPSIRAKVDGNKIVPYNSGCQHHYVLLLLSRASGLLAKQRA